MTNEQLYRIVNRSFRCTADILVVLFDEGVFAVDLTEKVVHHRNNTTTYYNAGLMSEKDVEWDESVQDFVTYEEGIPHIITVDNTFGKIIKMKRVG